METVSQLLGGFGVLGVIGAVVLGGVVLFLLPWWALVDVVRSPRGSGARAFLAVALVLTWGFGSIVYGLFVTSSRALRVFTVAGVCLPLLILVPSTISLVTGARLSHQVATERDQAEMERILAEFQPGLLAGDDLDPFVAIHFTPGGTTPRAATLARFTPLGPEYATARDVDTTVRHVAHDAINDRYFALTRHEFGTITPSSGRFTSVEVDPSLGEFSWPKGVAFDSDEQAVIVMTSHVSTRFYRYDPRTSDWARLPSEIRDVPLVALTYSPAQGCLYALEHRHGDLALRTIHRFNSRGASLGIVELNPPIPISRDQTEFFQLHHGNGKLMVVLPALDATRGASGSASAVRGGNRILVIDPTDGRVSASLGSVEASPGNDLG